MNQAAEKTDLLPDRVSCLVASLVDRKLLLPITAVAEVINTVTMPESGNDKTALYGWINWRNQRVPVISLENAMGGDRPHLKLENRMAVLNAVGDGAGLGFYAILLQALPTPVQVNAEIMREEELEPVRLVLTEAMVGEERVTVPDLLAIEKVVATFGTK